MFWPIKIGHMLTTFVKNYYLVINLYSLQRSAQDCIQCWIHWLQCCVLSLICIQRGWIAKRCSVAHNYTTAFYSLVAFQNEQLVLYWKIGGKKGAKVKVGNENENVHCTVIRQIGDAKTNSELHTANKDKHLSSSWASCKCHNAQDFCTLCKFVLQHVTKAQNGRRRNLGAPAALPPVKSPCTHWTRGWVGLGASLTRCA